MCENGTGTMAVRVSHESEDELGANSGWGACANCAPEKHQEARFGDTLVEEFERRLRAREFERPATIAEPRMLGTLRRKFSPALEQTVVAELAKDLTKVCRQDLEATIAALGI